jgi:hypothetical protein
VVGLIKPKLCQNCYEHIEHTSRIHQIYNYFPLCYHYPDLSHSYDGIRQQQDTTSVIGKSNRPYLKSDYKIMIDSLGWKGMPLVSIKRLDLSKIKKL